MAKAKRGAGAGKTSKTATRSTAKTSTGRRKAGGARTAGRSAGGKAAGGRASGRRASGRAAGGRAPASRAGTVGSGKGTIGKSGEGLDGGVARREAGDPGAIGTRPTAARKPAPRKAKAQLPGEKAVRDTDRSFPVAPERVPPGEREPMPDAAIDRRRQIVGTDDPADNTSP